MDAPKMGYVKSPITNLSATGLLGELEITVSLLPFLCYQL